MIGKEGAPPVRLREDLHDVADSGIIRRRVVEACGHTPRPLGEPLFNESSHLSDLICSRTPVIRTVDPGPDGIEADIGPNVDGQTTRFRGCKLIGQIRRPTAIGIEDHGGDPLAQHIHSRGEAFR